MRYLYCILLVVLFTCVGCQFKLSSDDVNENSLLLEIDRYDRLEYRYLTTGDFSALQQMNTEYPIETRTLIEDVVKIGEITDPDINTKFLKFYQDTTLQSVIAAVESEFANTEDLDHQFSGALQTTETGFAEHYNPKSLCADIGFRPECCRGVMVLSVSRLTSISVLIILCMRSFIRQHSVNRCHVNTSFQIV